jgi:hypothetical protein
MQALQYFVELREVRSVRQRKGKDGLEKSEVE